MRAMCWKCAFQSNYLDRESKSLLVWLVVMAGPLSAPGDLPPSYTLQQ